MQAIWKFPIQYTDKIVISIPKNAKVLCVQSQGNKPCLWAICDVDAEVEDRIFAIYGTGHQHESIGGEYVGTFQLHGGTFVFHVFEVE